jgi:predicted acylesterase/phospholipase RssA
MQSAKDKSGPFKERLEEERERFRSTLPANAEQLWARHSRRVGVVLSGGGARGAYEAGVLLAFQDAKLPTHVIAATSVGSINAAFYAANSDTLVGNAESLVETWSEVTPPAVGIDWFRYMLVLSGLIAASAGIGNMVRDWINEYGFYVHMYHPKSTWFTLFLVGSAVLFFYDDAPYLFYVVRNYFRRGHWKADRKKLLRSFAANAVVLGCVLFFFLTAHVHVVRSERFNPGTEETLLIVAFCLMLLVLAFIFRESVNKFSHKFLRLPLHTGLFPNFERTRFLRARIPVDGLKKSPIRLVMTAADVSTGSEKCFTNATQQELLDDSNIDSKFVRDETKTADDVVLSVIASSAFPIVYETVPLGGDMWTDGGIVSNQPIRPAIRMGAEVLFLVLVQPAVQRHDEIKTFLDLGVRALDILMSQNLRTDLKILKGVNSLCKQYADDIGVRPEQIFLHVGPRKYRFLKAFTVAPADMLPLTVLDFDGAIAAPAIAQGYRDGARTVQDYINYILTMPESMIRHEVRLVAEQMPTSQSASHGK